MKIKTHELKEKYINFFQEKEHTQIPNASLIPENDPTVLFTMAGMHPLVPYLLGEPHPGGQRLVNVQRCIRTGDIEEVGDAWHLTFFEMLGNWSLGDYFKKASITWSYEFLTKHLNIPREKLYFTCFAGDKDFQKDSESYEIWLSLGVDPKHLFYLPKADNFWILGSGIGPCGPDTEIFYATDKDACSSECNPSCSCGKYVEIWNNVFMEYYCDEQGKITSLTKQNVDTGMGLERTVAILNGLESVYDIDVFTNIKQKLEDLTNKKYADNLASFRIIMDHIRAATFILNDGIVPTNIGQGYVLRRLIRRMIRHLKKLAVTNFVLSDLALVVITDYQTSYPELLKNKDFVLAEIIKEEEKFNKTLKDGENLFYKVIKKLDGKVISGPDTFKLFDTFGFPLEFTEELAQENGLSVDVEGFKIAFKEHQEKSKTLGAGAFKGGLADTSYETTKYHTLAHLILSGLHEMYGPDVIQKGANITSERIRFDFNLDHKMSEDEIAKLEQIVNEQIKASIPVICTEMPYEKAKEQGAHGTFADRYGSLVKVYSIGTFSQEICGGPHIKNTNELSSFKIIKEESISAGVRRIKAIIE